MGYPPEDRRRDRTQTITTMNRLPALAFKIATDQFVGKLAYFRVYSGKVIAGSYILNCSTGEKERVGRIVRMHADKREDMSDVTAGDIAAIVGLERYDDRQYALRCQPSDCSGEHYLPRAAG